MKATLKYDLEDLDDRADHQVAIRARRVRIALSRIRTEIFRPARKHGYSSSLPALNVEGDNYEVLLNAISELESMYSEILSDEEISDLEE